MNIWIYLDAVVVIQSIASITRCKAESAPMVISVPQKSLSIDPTRPTIFKCLYCSALSAAISSGKKATKVRSNRLLTSPMWTYSSRLILSKDYPILYERDWHRSVNHHHQYKQYYWCRDQSDSLLHASVQAAHEILYNEHCRWSFHPADRSE